MMLRNSDHWGNPGNNLGRFMPLIEWELMEKAERPSSVQ